jgi:hypothetical protein
LVLSPSPHAAAHKQVRTAKTSKEREITQRVWSLAGQLA